MFWDVLLLSSKASAGSGSGDPKGARARIRYTRWVGVNYTKCGVWEEIFRSGLILDAGAA